MGTQFFSSAPFIHVPSNPELNTMKIPICGKLQSMHENISFHLESLSYNNITHMGSGEYIPLTEAYIVPTE